MLGRVNSLLGFSLNTDNFEGHLQNFFGHGKVMLWISLGADWAKLYKTFSEITGFELQTRRNLLPLDFSVAICLAVLLE